MLVNIAVLGGSDINIVASRINSTVESNLGTGQLQAAVKLR